MTLHFADIARQAAADGAISTEEILALRRAGWGDGALQPEEAEVLFDLNESLTAPDAAWSDFFVEAIVEFVVNGTAPRGYVSEANAAWLMARIDRDGARDSLTELELLVRVLERGCNVPDTLKAYVLSQVEAAVLTGSGPTRRAPSRVRSAVPFIGAGRVGRRAPGVGACGSSLCVVAAGHVEG